MELTQEEKIIIYEALIVYCDMLQKDKHTGKYWLKKIYDLEDKFREAKQ